jgi:hypothetical protein
MALDARLMNLQILTLAAMRAKQRQERQADPYAVVWLGMDGLPEDPADEGRSPSGLYLPRKAASVEEWYHSPLIAGMRAKLQALVKQRDELLSRGTGPRIFRETGSPTFMGNPV